jgi:predicted XRE-type DNA-binding protein
MMKKGRHPRNKTGYLPTGKNHHFYETGMKITRSIAQSIKDDGRKQIEIARELGVHQSLISKIKHGRIWK